MGREEVEKSENEEMIKVIKTIANLDILEWRKINYIKRLLND